jgi:hypothetical protein
VTRVGTGFRGGYSPRKRSILHNTAVPAADRLELTTEDAGSATDFADFAIEKIASDAEVVAFSTAIPGFATENPACAIEFAASVGLLWGQSSLSTWPRSACQAETVARHSLGVTAGTITW